MENAPGDCAGSLKLRAMKGILVVTFDFLDENGHRIVDYCGGNTLTTEVQTDNLSINDYTDLSLYLTDSLHRYAIHELSRPLFPHLPVPIGISEQHNNEYHKYDLPSSEHQENCK